MESVNSTSLEEGQDNQHEVTGRAKLLQLSKCSNNDKRKTSDEGKNGKNDDEGEETVHGSQGQGGEKGKGTIKETEIEVVEENQGKYITMGTMAQDDGTMGIKENALLTWPMEIEGESILRDSPLMVQPLKMMPWNAVDYTQELEEGWKDAEYKMDDWMEEIETNQEEINKESDKEENHQIKQWSVPKRKARKAAKPCQPTRQSSRVPKDGLTISEKAERRMEALNNISGNSFALFNLVDNKYLEELAVDANISLGENKEDITSQIDAIRAQEAAQVAIDNLEKENRKKKEDERKELEQMGNTGLTGNEDNRNKSVVKITSKQKKVKVTRKQMKKGGGKTGPKDNELDSEGSNRQEIIK